MNNDIEIIDTGASRGTVKSYVLGFLLSIIFTLGAFIVAVKHPLASGTVATIILFGIAQLFVQLVFFLHLDAKSKQRWNLVVFVFTAFIVLILVVGSLWIMYHLDYNMSLSPQTTNEGVIPQ